MQRTTDHESSAAQKPVSLLSATIVADRSDPDADDAIVYVKPSVLIAGGLRGLKCVYPNSFLIYAQCVPVLIPGGQFQLPS